MLIKKIIIINKLGLHARAATKFSNTAKKYASTIQVTLANKTIDGKSIMSLMLLAAAKGSEIELSIDGKDEQSALEDICQLINNRFGEKD